MAIKKEYRVVDKVGVVGFNGIIHKAGSIFSERDVPAANLNAWLRFGQVEEVKEDVKSAEPITSQGKQKTTKDK